MAFGGFDKRYSSAPIAEINMIPLIDVMLVLLVIFIVTAPLLTHAVKIDLPKASSNPNITKPDNVQFGIKADGALFWNGEALLEAQLAARFAATAAIAPQPEIHIRADENARYESVGKVVATCQRASILKIGFITEPPARSLAGG